MISFRVASRYLFGRGAHSVVKAISWVSVVAVAVPVMAMVIILSLHNGLSSFMEDMYVDFDAPMRITAQGGSSVAFDVNDSIVELLKNIDGVKSVGRVLETNVLLSAGDEYIPAVIRGVDSTFFDIISLDTRVVQGRAPSFKDAAAHELLLGQGVAYDLGIRMGIYQPVEVYAMSPRSEYASLFDNSIYSTVDLMPCGVFQLDQQTDARYVFASIQVVRDLMGIDSNQVNWLDISLDDKADYGRVADVVRRIMNSDIVAENKLSDPQGFKILSRFQQNETMYKAMSGEKVIIYIMLVMVLLIAMLSLVGQSAMLITEKRRQIQTIRVMGGSLSLVRRIFVWQGFLTVIIGAGLGVCVGVIFCLAQQWWGLIQMSGDSFLMQEYPVKIVFSDIVMILSSVVVLSILLLEVVCRVAIKND